MVKPEVNFRSRINTGAAPASPPWRRATPRMSFRNPLKAGVSLNRSFSVFVNVLATNAA
jgi:hypothetical protein